MQTEAIGGHGCSQCVRRNCLVNEVCIPTWHGLALPGNINGARCLESRLPPRPFSRSVYLSAGVPVAAPVYLSDSLFSRKPAVSTARSSIIPPIGNTAPPPFLPISYRSPCRFPCRFPSRSLTDFPYRSLDDSLDDSSDERHSGPRRDAIGDPPVGGISRWRLAGDGWPTEGRMAVKLGEERLTDDS